MILILTISISIIQLTYTLNKWGSIYYIYNNSVCVYIHTEINTNIYIQILYIYICTHCPYVYSQYLYGCESVCVVSVKERGGKSAAISGCCSSFLWKKWISS